MLLDGLLRRLTSRRGWFAGPSAKSLPTIATKCHEIPEESLAATVAYSEIAGPYLGTKIAPRGSNAVVLVLYLERPSHLGALFLGLRRQLARQFGCFCPESRDLLGSYYADPASPTPPSHPPENSAGNLDIFDSSCALHDDLRSWYRIQNPAIVR